MSKHNTNTQAPVSENAVTYYVDGGDYQRNKDASEVYLRATINGEQFDICNFGCNESEDVYEDALNVKIALSLHDELVEALKIARTYMEYEFQDGMDEDQRQKETAAIDSLLAKAQSK